MQPAVASTSWADPEGGRTGEHCGFVRMLAEQGVVSVFQPIVALETGEPVAYEALARGPEGPWSRPDVMFRTADELGLVAELDEACRISAIRTAHSVGLLDGSILFINVEPRVMDRAALGRLVDAAGAHGRPLPVVLEVTERALARQPGELLRTVAMVREQGWGIALDDVGAEPASLSFLSLLEPDVVKLDMALVQERLGAEQARVMHSVNAYAERSGALVLAEGIETADHLDNARALGATLGQGWMFGRPTSSPRLPGPGDSCDPRADRRPRFNELGHDPTVPSALSPFAALPTGTRLQRAPKRLLIEISKLLEAEATRVGETCVVAATFQELRHLTPATRHRYELMGTRMGFVCVFGDDVPADPVPGVRGASLRADDPVRHEWDLIALSPHFAVALLARDLDPHPDHAGPEIDRPFEYALTYDRATVVRAARSLLERVDPL